MTTILHMESDARDREFWDQSIHVMRHVYDTSRLDTNHVSALIDTHEVDILTVFVHSVCNAATLSQFGNLACICTRSSGTNHIDLDYCKSRNIAVYNVLHYEQHTLAEYTMMMILTVARRLKEVMNHASYSHDARDLIGFDLYGKTLGIIGLGSIGKQVALRAQAFGMRVIAYDIVPDMEFVTSHGIELLSSDDVMSQSDIISLHTPLTETTHHLLNDEAFHKMRQGVVVINTSRGDLIDTPALISNLRSNKILGAGLDVFAGEQIFIAGNCTPDVEYLLNHDRVIITPHNAYNTHEAYMRILQQTSASISEFVLHKMQ